MRSLLLAREKLLALVIRHGTDRIDPFSIRRSFLPLADSGTFVAMATRNGSECKLLGMSMGQQVPYFRSWMEAV